MRILTQHPNGQELYFSSPLEWRSEDGDLYYRDRLGQRCICTSETFLRCGIRIPGRKRERPKFYREHRFAAVEVLPDAEGGYVFHGGELYEVAPRFSDAFQRNQLWLHPVDTTPEFAAFLSAADLKDGRFDIYLHFSSSRKELEKLTRDSRLTPLRRAG